MRPGFTIKHTEDEMKEPPNHANTNKNHLNLETIEGSGFGLLAAKPLINI